MSNIHYIGGSGNAAAEYQSYLEQLRKRKPVRTFDSAIDTDREAEDTAGEQPSPDARQDAEPDTPPERRYA